MNRIGRTRRFVVGLVGVALAVTLLLGACGDDGDDAAPTEPPTIAIEINTDVPPTEAPDSGTAGPAGDEPIAFDAAAATITVDGDTSDWDGIVGVTVPLKQFELPPDVTFDDLDWDEANPLDPVDVELKVATDSDNIYMLLEVSDDYDFVLDDHKLSAALAVQFLIEADAGAHMGAGDDDFEAGLGMVDMWHWELDCVAGALSGGGGITGGDDPDCNFDDEFATDPEEREDDGGGDAIVNADAENSLAGVWQHTASATGADGTWIFEMSRPLRTGDPQDAQFTSGATILMALAYWDADESLEGWTDTGHLQSADVGWIEVTLP